MTKNVIPAKNLQPGMKIAYRGKVRTVRNVAPGLAEGMDGKFRVAVSLETATTICKAYFMPSRKCELL